MENSMSIFAFDLSSNFSRNYYKVKKAGVPNDGYIDGIPIFAVKSTIYQVLKEVRTVAEEVGKPTHLILTLDHEGDNFRDEIYPDYKGTRPPKEDDFYIQRDLVERIFQLMNIPCLKIKGYEADDVLATIGHKLTLAGIPLFVFTKDKDLLALVNDFVTIYNGQDRKYFDHQAVIDHKGVPPSRITDMLILEGDTIDNIIGIKGVGHSSSRQILERFTLEQILEAPDLLLDTKVRAKASIVNYIKENMEFIHLMRDVATMRTDVALSSNLNEWKVVNFPYAKSDAYRTVESLFNFSVNELKKSSIS